MFENIKSLFSKNAKSNKITGIDEAPVYNSPGQPLAPIQNFEVEELYSFDFPMNQNQNSDYAQMNRFERLRFLAKDDLVRTAINKRKDQITRYDYKFLIKNSATTDARTEALTQFFKKPDREHRFDQWLSMIIEDHLVIDAVTIYPQKNRGGNIHALRVVDSATIFPLIDAYGFTPLDGSPAYQQKKGNVIVSNWSYDELIYSIKNKSSNKLHGYSIVESIENVINLMIRKTHSQLDYFQKGNTPSLLISAPEGWKANDIMKFQKMWNEMQKGVVKYGTSVMIPSEKVHNTKPEQLKNEFDEWIARRICYAFSLPPTALMNDNNRATAETAKESAREEGAEALLDFISNLINGIIEEHFGFNDIEFLWNIETETDPLILSQIECSYVEKGIRTVNEIRIEHGWEALEEPIEVEEEEEEDISLGKFAKKKL